MTGSTDSGARWRRPSRSTHTSRPALTSTSVTSGRRRAAGGAQALDPRLHPADDGGQRCPRGAADRREGMPGRGRGTSSSGSGTTRRWTSSSSAVRPERTAALMPRSADRVRAGGAAGRRGARHRRPGRPPGRGRSRPAPAPRGLPRRRPSQRAARLADDDQTVGPARLTHRAVQRQVARPQHEQREVSRVDDVRRRPRPAASRHRRRPAPPAPGQGQRPGLARRPPVGDAPSRRGAAARARRRSAR